MDEGLEIRREPRPHGLELKVSGRLDNTWSRQLQQALQEEIRAGSHALILDLSQVGYLSSAGIRVLVMAAKQLQGLGGSLAVSAASAAVAGILKAVGLGSAMSRAPAAKAAGPEPRRLADLSYTLQELPPAAPMALRAVAGPAPRREAFPDSRFGVGIGALGAPGEDCRGRCGEFMALAGCAACLPADGRSRPDYAAGAAGLVAEVEVLKGLVWEGRFSRLMRFSPAPGARRVGLSLVVEAALAALPGASHAALVVLAEASGLVGAALSAPAPQESAAGSLFDFPGVRDKLFFTTERVHGGGLVVAAGVAARAPAGGIADLTRPMKPGSDLAAHFHAAVFPYRPWRQDETDLARLVLPVFEAGDIQALLHLVNDDRDAVGLGESEFFRGACWLAEARP